MTKEELALEVIARLKKEYPDAGCTLDYDQAWKLLVSVRLAAQCTDARVNVVVEELYAKYPDVASLAAAEPEEIEEICRTSTPVTRFFRDATAHAAEFNMRDSNAGLCLHDVCPLLFLSNPELFRGEAAGVYVETQSELTRGKTVTDLYSDHQFETKNAFVVLDIDRPRFLQIVSAALRSY